MQHINLADLTTPLKLRTYPVVEPAVVYLQDQYVVTAGSIDARFTSIGDSHEFTSTLVLSGASQLLSVLEPMPFVTYTFFAIDAYSLNRRVGMYWVELRKTVSDTLSPISPFKMYDNNVMDVIQVHLHNNDETFTITESPSVYTVASGTTYYNG